LLGLAKKDAISTLTSSAASYGIQCEQLGSILTMEVGATLPTAYQVAHLAILVEEPVDVNA
jgi:hypothetical protein